MDFCKYLRKDFICEACGKKHHCDTEAVYVEPGAISHIAPLLEGYNKLLLVTDENTFSAGGSRVLELLENAGHKVIRAHFQQTEPIIPDEAAVKFITDRFESGVGAIVGVGSGVINDLCKYVGSEKGVPNMIVGTAPSMDGFATNCSVMILGGLKYTVPRQAPRWIIGDTDILKEAPIDMIRSGIGDILGKYSALSDWKLADMLSEEKVCPMVYDMVEHELNECVEHISGYLTREAEAVGKLMTSLVLIGIGAGYTGNSRPGSGAEHILSHYFELTGLLWGKPYYPHGIDVGHTSLVIEKLRNRLAEEDPEEFTTDYDRQEWEFYIRRLFGPLAKDVIAMQDKAMTYRKSPERLEWIREHWYSDILPVLKQTPGVERMRELLHEVGFEPEDFREMYGSANIRSGIVYSGDLKTRYTLLLLLRDTGMLERYAMEVSL